MQPPSLLPVLLLSEQGWPLLAGKIKALPRLGLALTAFCHLAPGGLIFHCSLLLRPRCLLSEAVGPPTRLLFGPFFPPDIRSLINCT